MVVLDEAGQELELVVCNTICPIERVAEGREIAIRHMQEVEAASEDRRDEMLTIGLVSKGNNASEVTHFLCGREASRGQVAAEAATLRRHLAEGKEWCSGREMRLDDAPEEIKSKFCCVVGETDELLDRLGLERVKPGV